MLLREASTAMALADYSAEAVIIMAGIVRRHERLSEVEMTDPTRREIGCEIADMKTRLFDLEAARRRAAVLAVS